MPVRRRDRKPCPRGTLRALARGKKPDTRGAGCVSRCTGNVQNRAAHRDEADRWHLWLEKGPA